MTKLLKILSVMLVVSLGYANIETPSSIEKNPTETLQTSPKMSQETQYVIYCLEKGHYLKTPLRDHDLRELVREYMANLDFLKLFFLTEDLQHYQDLFSPTIDIYLHQGTLLPAFAIYGKFLQRANSRLEWITERMKKPFDFSSKETYNPDRKKEEWPKNIEDADSLWEKKLKFDLINQILSYDASKDEDDEDDEYADLAIKDEEESKEEKPKTFEEKLEKAKAEVLKRYENLIKNLKKSDAMEIQEAFLGSIASMYDPHSTFLSEYSLEEFDIAIRNSLVGIGAVLQDKDGYCIIAELLPGSPAEKSGQIKTGDKIVAVAEGDGEFIDVIGDKLRNTVRLIRGKTGTKVRLAVEPAGNPAGKKIVSLIREEVQLTTKLAKATIYEVPEGDKNTIAVGVIDIPAFYGEAAGDDGAKGFSTTKDVEELLVKLKEKGVKGIILDMRRNGGGFLNEAIDLAGLFIRTGPVLQVKNANGKVIQLRDDNPKLVWNGPLIILVSRLSASATEIVAGALKDHEVAIIVGDKNTHGKGTVQAVWNLANLDPKLKSATKVTIQKWYAPNGDSIQVRGIKSDIELPSLYDFLDIGEDKKDYVLPWDAIESVDFTKGYGYGQGEKSNELLSFLKENSEKRQADSNEIKLLNEKIDWMKSKKDKKDWSINLIDREKQLEKDENFSKEIKTKEKNFAKNNFKKEEILLNSAIAKEEEAKKSKIANGEASDKVADSEGQKESHQHPKKSRDEIQKEREKNRIDVQLRESLRIMADWIEYTETSSKE